MSQNRPRGLRWLGPLAGPVDRFLSGGKSADPLYLSNQTLWQKSRRIALIALPLLLVAGIVALSSARLIVKKTAPAAELTAAEVAARSLPDYTKLDLRRGGDIAVLEAEVNAEGGARIVTGRIRNNTDRRFAVAEVVLDMMDTAGSQLGAEIALIEDVKPRAIIAFRIRVQSPEAAVALVRDVRTR